MTNWRIEVGDCRDVLRSMPAGSVHTVVTSPPYFGLRDYGTGEWEGGDPACDHRQDIGAHASSGLNGSLAHKSGEVFTPYRETCGKCGARRVDRQIGLEPTPDEFVAALVGVFRGVRRVLRDDGTVWLNLGDSYATRWGSVRDTGRGGLGSDERRRASTYATTDGGAPRGGHDAPQHPPGGRAECADASLPAGGLPGASGGTGPKEKDLIGVPWLVAFALRADGWYLRSDIVWSKPNPMPESVTDRPTKAHEYVFLLSKGPRYFYDDCAIREGSDWGRENNPEWQHQRAATNERKHPTNRNGKSGGFAGWDAEQGRNKRSVWTVATQPYAGAHFATFPPKLIEPCILAGAPERACGECGAPWVRVTDVERAFTDRPGHPTRYGDTPTMSAKGLGMPSIAPPVVTTRGFEPSCSHGDGSARGVVLDPFAGAGTTGLVALQHGREFVGIELSPAYAQMARDRISAWERCGFRNPANGAAPPEGQESLFSL